MAFKKHPLMKQEYTYTLNIGAACDNIREFGCRRDKWTGWSKCSGTGLPRGHRVLYLVFYFLFSILP
jgi:hypothetical protein